MPSEFSQVSKCGVGRFGKSLIVFTASSWLCGLGKLVSLADFIGLFSNLRGRARKGNVRRLGIYVISSPRLVFRAPFPFCSYAMCMTSVFTPIKWVKYAKSSYKTLEKL